MASITIIPHGFIFLQPFFSNTQSGQSLAQLFTSAYLQTTLRNTIIMSAGAMVFTVLLGVPLAWLLTRTNLPHRKKLRTLFMMPYIIPPGLILTFSRGIRLTDTLWILLIANFIKYASLCCSHCCAQHPADNHCPKR